jgi:hypothetical protein
MKQRGLSLEQITQETDIELEVLKQFLPEETKALEAAHLLRRMKKSQSFISQHPPNLITSHP